MHDKDDDENTAPAEEAALGETRAACPHCGAFALHRTNRETWRCPLCGHTFSDPAYYQRVPAPVVTPEPPE